MESIIGLGIEIHYAMLPSMRSDHWPIELMWSGMGSQFKNPFRFEQFLLENTYFHEKLKMWWEELIVGDDPSIYKFQQQLKGMKSKIKNATMKNSVIFSLIKKSWSIAFKTSKLSRQNLGYTMELKMEELSVFPKIEE